MILIVYSHCQSCFSESVESNVADIREDSMDLECESMVGNIAGCAAVAPPEDIREDSMDLECESMVGNIAGWAAVAPPEDIREDTMDLECESMVGNI